MAGAQVTSVGALMLEKQREGYQAISLTHMADLLEPQISAGSVVEVSGSLYEFAALESITGWAGIANSSATYIKLTVAGAAITASFTITPPTGWSDSKQGHYTGLERYIGGLYKDSSGQYVAKSVWPSNPNADPIGTIKMFDGLGWGDNCTLPGWYACIAANAGQGCPDMVDKFIMGKVVAGVGVNGGETAKTITDDRLYPHTHSIPTYGSTGSGAIQVQGTGHTDYVGSVNTVSAGAAAKLNISPGSYSAIFIRRCA